MSNKSTHRQTERRRYARRRQAQGAPYKPFDADQLERARKAREETERLTKGLSGAALMRVREKLRKQRQRERSQRWRMRHLYRSTPKNRATPKK